MWELFEKEINYFFLENYSHITIGRFCVVKNRALGKSGIVMWNPHFTKRQFRIVEYKKNGDLGS